MSDLSSLSAAITSLEQGDVILYPTEAVYGLGCDPDNQQAVERLLSIKQRPVEKGLILLAGNYAQLLPYIDVSKIPHDKLNLILSRWPDGITQLIPKNKNISSLLSGVFDSIAVRITSQPDVKALCEQTNKPIVSTSANLSGQEPAKTWQTIDQVLVEQVDFIVQGKTLGHTSPSKIIDALTDKVIRS